MNFDNVVGEAIQDVIDGLLTSVGGTVRNFKTEEGDGIAVVHALGVITLGVLESENERLANAVLTKDEARELARTLLEFSDL